MWIQGNGTASDAAVVYIWNGTIPKPHIHKDWQWPVATWFNHPCMSLFSLSPPRAIPPTCLCPNGFYHKVTSHIRLVPTLMTSFRFN
uniref:Uncharacterized protein n=1 Tax=Castor canadensis TaxID=51338 RepID=A0A8C0W1Q4_CASCN